MSNAKITIDLAITTDPNHRIATTVDITANPPIPEITQARVEAAMDAGLAAIRAALLA